VDSIGIKDGRFRYTEKNTATMREGSFTIEQVNGGVTNVTNVPERLQANKTCTIALKGRFMGQSSIAATFRLDLVDTLGGFSVSGEHKNLDAGEIRSMVRALAVADLQSMHAGSIKFSVAGNQDGADGNLTMRYSDLKVKLLKVEDDKDLKKQGLLSFIAQATLIYKANPMDGEEVRHVVMHQDRRPTGSFFNLIWKALFEGITETMLRTDGAADFVQDAKPGKKKDKNIIKTIKQVFKNDKKDKK